MYFNELCDTFWYWVLGCLIPNKYYSILESLCFKRYTAQILLGLSLMRDP